MNPRPIFEEWLAEPYYDKLLWGYKQVLKYLLYKKIHQDITSVIKLRRSHDKLHFANNIYLFVLVLLGWLNFILKKWLDIIRGRSPIAKILISQNRKNITE